MTSQTQVTSPPVPLRTVRRPLCISCNNPGKTLYNHLQDRLHDTPGEWQICQCAAPSCGLLWLDPLPHPGDIHRAYHTYYTHAPTPQDRRWMRLFALSVQERYLHKRWGYPRNKTASWIDRVLLFAPKIHPGLKAHLDAAVMHLKAHPGGRLLDIGSGSGEAITRMNGLGWQAEGLEVDQQAVAYARGRGLLVTHGELEDFSKSYLFDAITMTHVLEHLADPLKSLQTCFQLLKPGGQLVITTPNTRSSVHLKFKQHWLSLDPPRHLFGFNRPSLEILAQQAGFKNLNFKFEVREANTVFIASQIIQNASHWQRENLGSLLLRIKGQWSQYLQSWQTARGKDVAEELVLIATK